MSFAELHFIGIVTEAGEQEARIHIFPDYCAGLKGLSEFSHVIILYWIHLRDNENERRDLLVVPRRHLLESEVGVFACRSPSRPNPIGFCVVEVLGVEDCFLRVKGLDACKGSPIVDVKPYIPRADSIPDTRVPDWMKHGAKT